MTSLRDIIARIGEIAPKKYSVKGFQGRVEIGPQTLDEQSKTTISRVLISTYISSKIAAKASQDKANLIISFRRFFGSPRECISGFDLIRTRLLIKNYISTYSIGSPWVVTRGGMSDALVESLGLIAAQDFLVVADSSELVPLARVCKAPSVINHSGFVNYVASKLGIHSISFTGDLDEDASNILVCPANLLGEEELQQAHEVGVSTIVTAEVTPSVRMTAKESGIGLLELGTFVTENPGMKRLRHQLTLEFPDLKIEYVDSEPITQSLVPYKDTMA